VFLPGSNTASIELDCTIQLTTAVQTQFIVAGMQASVNETQSAVNETRYVVNETQSAVNAIRSDINQLVTSQAFQAFPAHATRQKPVVYRPVPMPSPRFMGRSDYLSRLRQYFSTQFTSQRRQFLLYGLGGAGKTQISLKFASESLDLLVLILLHCILSCSLLCVDSNTSSGLMHPVLRLSH
jgi:hypothetical protein